VGGQRLSVWIHYSSPRPIPGGAARPRNIAATAGVYDPAAISSGDTGRHRKIKGELE